MSGCDNEKGIFISNIGHTMLHTPKHTFTLYSVLHVVSFAGNLRVIAEGDASALEFLLTPSAFHVVFLSCVSVSIYFSSFLLLCFQNKPLLSLGLFHFFVVLGWYW